MRAALRGGFFVGFSRRKRPVKRPLRISTELLRRTARKYVYRCRRSKCAYISDESTQVLPSALLRCATSRNVRYASLYAFNDGFYLSFQPSFSFAFLPCAFLILLPKYGKRAPFRTRVRMTAIFLILPKSYLRECWTCCRSS